jgi:hypothetical protein
LTFPLSTTDILKPSRFQLTQAAMGADAPEPNRCWNASRRHDERASTENLFTHGVLLTVLLGRGCADATKSVTIAAEALGGRMA